jgi:HlyD family secretion protein
MEAVYASGFVVSDQEYQVFSQADGTLKQVVVKEGELVKKGQPLLIVESVQQGTRYTMAKEAYQQAVLNKTPVMAELEATLQSARSKMQFDSINFVRYANLLKSNATARVEYDRAEIQYKNSRNDFLAVKNRLIKTQNDLDLAIQNSYNQLKISEEESGNYILRSDIDGMVFKITKEQGELVRRSEVVAVVGKPDNFLLRLTVDELDIQRVKVGQEVAVKIDAYPDQLYHGKVSKVYPLVDTRQQSLRVDVLLTEKLPGLFSGLAVEANIIIRQKDKALVIPRQSILPGDSVLISTTTGVKKVKVIRGIETLEETEIISGLEAESKLIVN